MSGEEREEQRDRPASEVRRRRWLGFAALITLGFVALALWIASPVLRGEWLSDDHLYIVGNVYVHGLSWENAREILHPLGVPTVWTWNYAPVHLFLHAVEWELFGPGDMRGWHAVNAILHGLTSALLIALFLRSQIPRAAAVLGAAFFLVHPANVETVAWIFQLKTIVSLGLSVAALLAHPRRPLLGLALFALAILTKVTAVGVLPMVLVQAWVRSSRGERAGWGWLAAWAAVLAVVSIPEWVAFQSVGESSLGTHSEPMLHARTVVAIAMRYLAMAATGWGVSAFHQPPGAESWLDPWWLAGLACLGLLAWRLLVSLRRREEEAAYWVMAAAAFAPVSQIFPFIFSMGDRYLYPILPGLIGGLLLAGMSAAAELRERWEVPASVRAHAPKIAVWACVLLLLGFAVRSRDRAPVFLTMRSMMVDAALHYPDGMQANLLRGQRYAQDGDAVAAAAAIRRAVDLGFDDLQQLLRSPGLETVRRHPDFAETLRHLATINIARLSRHGRPDQMVLMHLGLAYSVTGEDAEAIRSWERALEMGGPFDVEIRNLARSLRARQPSEPKPGSSH